jgi:hypothetical protein
MAATAASLLCGPNCQMFTKRQKITRRTADMHLLRATIGCKYANESADY